jgi:hypothetical protein
MMADLSKIGMYWRFAWGLGKLLKEPITLEQSREIISQRLQNREQNLLTIVKKAIYENSRSPYLPLLRLAGCEYGDFEQMVHSDGIEPTLKELCQEGVYLTIEEFKGKKAVTRGGKAFIFRERDFDNPCSARHLGARSGASRSAGTRTYYDFNYIALVRAAHTILCLAAFDALNSPIILVHEIMPGSGPLLALSAAKAGKPVMKWFSPTRGRDIKPSLRDRLATGYMVGMGRLYGRKLPAPQYLSMDEAWRVAHLIPDTIKRYGGCCVQTSPSWAIRICQAAKRKGLDIIGVKFISGGEPLTEAKRREIESAGARIHMIYALREVSFAGLACLHPVTTGEVHLTRDSLALIQHEREVPHAGVSVNAFLLTTLLPFAPKILLNVETGDYGMVESRSCGCYFDKLGFSEHLYEIRGFDKLTSEGMTFLGTEMLRIIEEVLPAKFGGSSIDYQIIEEEDEASHSRISIVVSPEVGDINENEVIETVLHELAKGKGAKPQMANVWQQAKTLRVKRTLPFTARAGKLLPLHIKKGK